MRAGIFIIATFLRFARANLRDCPDPRDSPRFTTIAIALSRSSSPWSWPYPK
jgi:hypothetical protein